MSDRLSRDGNSGRDGVGRRLTLRAQLPLLDRLIDISPDTTSDPPVSAAGAMDALRASIRNDLEALLNSRRRWRSWDAHLTQLDRSLVGFGLPDFAAGAFNDARRREELRALVEASIRRFEPRIASLTVTLVDATDDMSATFRIRIDALMEADPAPEPIMFDTLIDPLTKNVTVIAKET